MKISNTSERLNQLMNERNLKQKDILDKAKQYTEKLGVRLAKNDLSQYVSGKVEPSQQKLTILGLALGVSEPWLMGYDVPRNRQGFSERPDNIIKLDKVNKIPVLGEIACGDPILAQENLQGHLLVDFIQADFALIARGDSMENVGITEGDYCFIRQQPTVENGEIAAVLIGDEATLKKVYKTDNQIILMPENDKYDPIILTEDIKILGKLVGTYKSVD